MAVCKHMACDALCGKMPGGLAALFGALSFRVKGAVGVLVLGAEENWFNG